MWDCLTVCRTKKRVSICLHVSDERTYDGNSHAYDGLYCRFQTRISTIHSGPMRNVRANKDRQCRGSVHVLQVVVVERLFHQLLGDITLGTMNVVLERKDWTMGSTFTSDCMRRANRISINTRPQPARTTFVRASSKIFYIVNFNPSLESK